MTRKINFQSVVPPTAAEAAITDAAWERRGFLGRLVRIDEVVSPPQERHTRALSARPL
ncbi:MAG: hypothetical protein QOH23_1880 [Gaiellaceae bacterium]|jgi:hypothetical protein|nr:hypothetical protein [Gaiellaceae bacterium]